MQKQNHNNTYLLPLSKTNPLNFQWIHNNHWQNNNNQTQQPNPNHKKSSKTHKSGSKLLWEKLKLRKKEQTLTKRGTCLGLVKAKMRKITMTMKRRRHLGWNTHAGKTLTIVLILLKISLIYLILLHGSQHKKIPPRLPERDYFGFSSWRVSRKIKAVIAKNWNCFFAIIFSFARSWNNENNVVDS